MPDSRNAIALNRAAQHERRTLEAHRARVVGRARTLDEELGALRHELRRIDERIRLLDALLTGSSPVETDQPTSIAPYVLRGAELREQAMRVLVARAGVRVPVDYKEWFGWVQEAGFVVLGKRPLATFLSSISRSPLVARGDAPGSYWIDPSVPTRLESELSELQGELNELTGVLARSDVKRPERVKHRIHLLASIRRLKRNVAEADSILATPRSITAARRSRDIA